MLRDFLRPLTGLVRSMTGTRGLADRLAAMDAKLDRLGGDVVQPGAAPAIDVNLMLHQARGAMLRAMPPGARRLLSAGCAGNWYFDWIEQCYGHVPAHLGIEFYTPEPPGLPANVTWIANTAADMAAVADASCDLVFSGQNLEHLWGWEVAGFLTEAARVLRTGGHLAVDSPNRAVTAPLNWSHPEHTVELTVPEIARLLELAGFDVTKRAGLYLCRDPRTGRMLPFDPNVADPDWSLTERLLAARDAPEQSLLWWLEGVRTARPPDRPAIEALLAEAWRTAWPERIQRLVVPAGRRIETRPASDGTASDGTASDGSDADGLAEDWIVMAPGETGMAFFGPYMPLRAGRHRVAFDIVPDPATRGVFAVCDVCAGPEATVLQACEVTPDMREAVLGIELDALVFGGQFRCRSTQGGFAVRRRVRLQETLR